MSAKTEIKSKAQAGLLKLTFVWLSFTPISAMATTYWVAANGSDSHPCSQSQPCASVQYGVNKLFAGDTLNIKAGTYYETDTDGAGFFALPVAINLPRSGTSAAPIIIQAAPGDEGNVTIDLQAIYAGFQLGGHQDHIHIKNLNIRNARGVAINVPDAGNISFNETSKWSIGLVIEGNKITDTYGDGAGKNNSAIRIYQVRDAIIRNNMVDRVGTTELVDEKSHNSCILSYALWNIKIEHNLFSRCGSRAVFWKTQALDLPSEGYQSIIRYNKFTNNYVSIVDSGKAPRTNSPHKILISNNIFENYYMAVDIADPFGGTAIVAHNFFNGEGSQTPGSNAIVIREVNNLQASIFGNIYHSNEDVVYDFRLLSDKLIRVDHNIFTSQPKSWLYGYNPYSFKTTTLNQWQGLVSESILPTPPDLNSVLSPIASMAVSLSSQNYKLPGGSLGLNFMPNGDNVGPYQRGSEVIGLLTSFMSTSTLTSNPNPPSSLSIKITP
ncbi:right-handed parallel beta-helix repeat-containing protein [Pseudomonadales bacterium]|nr:right-handed parallel beta-helix repeat-containing protein [Pseudomonadales bacterium]